MPFLLSMLALSVIAWHIYNLHLLLKEPKRHQQRHDDSSLQLNDMNDSVQLDDDISHARTNQHTNLI